YIAVSESERLWYPYRSFQTYLSPLRLREVVDVAGQIVGSEFSSTELCYKAKSHTHDSSNEIPATEL
ncbi:hypothetical protein AB6C93_25355, partial [Vibrio splendidus]